MARIPKAPPWWVVIVTTLPTGLITGWTEWPTIPVLVVNGLVVFVAVVLVDVVKKRLA